MQRDNLDSSRHHVKNSINANVRMSHPQIFHLVNAQIYTRDPLASIKTARAASGDGISI